MRNRGKLPLKKRKIVAANQRNDVKLSIRRICHKILEVEALNFNSATDTRVA